MSDFDNDDNLDDLNAVYQTDQQNQHQSSSGGGLVDVVEENEVLFVFRLHVWIYVVGN